MDKGTISSIVIQQNFTQIPIFHKVLIRLIIKKGGLDIVKTTFLNLLLTI
jgi:hypothetical protein